MEISITRNDLQHLLKQDKLLWNIYLKKSIRTIITFLIPALLILVDAYDRYSKTGDLSTITLAIGLALLIFILFSIGNTLLNRYLSNKDTNKAIKQTKDKNTIIISDWGIRVKGYDSASEFAWSFFKGYKIYKTSILVLPIHHSFQDIFIERSEIKAEEYEQLAGFLKGKFPAPKEKWESTV
ncbi:MAG: hypothetical protein QM791_05365 [Ferruginibacter sp.]